MRLHGNAALSWQGRRRLARQVVLEGWTLTAAASAAGVSVRCGRKWVGRYRLEGEAGLCDRSSAPKRVANRTPADRDEVRLAYDTLSVKFQIDRERLREAGEDDLGLRPEASRG
jgi:transposase